MNDQLIESLFVSKQYNPDGRINKMPFGINVAHLGLILSGSARFRSENVDVTVHEGEFIYIPRYLPYYSEWHGVPKTVHLAAGFGFLHPEKRTPYALQKVETDGDSLARRFLSLYEKSKEDPLAALSDFYLVLSTLDGCLTKAENRRESFSVLPAVTYIENHCSEDFDVPYLARLCGMSESYFYACFRSQTSKTPVEYKNYIRCRTAQELLLGTDLTVEAICARLNFSSPVSLRKALMKTTGKTPREIRKTIAGTM